MVLVDLTKNPSHMEEFSKKRSKIVYQNNPGESKKPKCKEVVLGKGIPVLTKEAERKIIESLAKQMDLNKYDDMIDAVTKKGGGCTCSISCMLNHHEHLPGRWCFYDICLSSSVEHYI